jgi:hypothetical protein
VDEKGVKNLRADVEDDEKLVRQNLSLLTGGRSSRPRHYESVDTFSPGAAKVMTARPLVLSWFFNFGGSIFAGAIRSLP